MESYKSLMKRRGSGGSRGSNLMVSQCFFKKKWVLCQIKQILQNLALHPRFPNQRSKNMEKIQLAPIDVVKEGAFELLLDSTLKSLKRGNSYGFNNEASHLLSKHELVALVRKAMNRRIPLKCCLFSQLLIGYLWSTRETFLRT